MYKLLKYISLAILAILTAFYFQRFCRFIGSTVESPRPYLAFVEGIIVYLILRFSLFRKNMEFLRTFNHELHHMIFSLFFLNKIDSFNAHAMGNGKITYYGKENFIITLAPYAISFPLIMALLLAAIWDKASLPILDGIVGVFLCFHLENAYLQSRPHQPDLRAEGFIFSYTFIICFNFITLAYAMVFSYYNHAAGWNFLKGGFTRMIDEIIVSI